MLNIFIPVSAVRLPALPRFDRAAIMRHAGETARWYREYDAEVHARRWSAEIRYNLPHPALKVRSWRVAMAEGFREAWREARRATRIDPAICAAIADTEFMLLAGQAIERPSPFDVAHINSLQTRLSELHGAAAARL